MRGSKKRKWQVYIIETQSGKFYTGITTNLSRRFSEHCMISPSKGAKFFRTDKPKQVVYQEDHRCRSDALKREMIIKRLTKNQKRKLVEEQYLLKNNTC